MTIITRAQRETKPAGNPSPSLRPWAALLALPLATTLAARDLPPWARMWALAAAVFLPVKAMSWLNQPALRARATPYRAALYLCAWPGMDVARFCDPRRTPAPPTAAEWRFAAAKLAFGALLLWVLLPRIPAGHPLITGWLGMAGILFVLHFGSFHLLALAYRAAGIDAVPIMRHPAAARTLSEFWGARWNRAFRDWSHAALFRPAERRLGRTGATLWTFFLSGLIHEAVITLPAGGGYGGPTAYFLFQGVGLLLERRLPPHRLLTLAWVIAPAGLLFPPVFVGRVILPFFHALHAL